MVGSSGLALAMAALALLVAVGVSAGIARATADRRWLLLPLWLAIPAGLALAGVTARFEVRPPPVLVLTLVAVVGAVALGRSRVGAAVAREWPLWGLVGLHAFRLPLEATMHHAYAEGVMPVQMSWSGANFDVVTGALATLLAAALLGGARVPRPALWAFDAVGIALLVNIVTIAAASTPLFAAFGPDRLNTWIGFFPYVWLPTVLVPAAAFGHVVLTRRLWADLPTGERPGSTAPSRASPS